MKRINTFLMFIGIMLVAGSLVAATISIKADESGNRSISGIQKEIVYYVTFTLPKVLYRDNINIESARLVFSASLADESSGELEIYPLVVADISETEKVDWKASKDKLNDIFSVEKPGKHVSIKAGKGVQEIRSNVTSIVKAWVDNVLSNRGVIITPPYTSKEVDGSKYLVDLSNAKLVVEYSVE